MTVYQKAVVILQRLFVCLVLTSNLKERADIYSLAEKSAENKILPRFCVSAILQDKGAILKTILLRLQLPTVSAISTILKCVLFKQA